MEPKARVTCGKKKKKGRAATAGRGRDAVMSFVGGLHNLINPIIK